MRCTLNLAIGAILTVCALAAPVAAEPSPLAQIPGEAPIVVHVRGAERMKGRLLDLVKNALPDEAARFVKTKLETALKLNGRELRGLPADGPIFVILPRLAEMDTKSFPAAFVLRVTSYADFRDGLLKEAERKALKKDAAGYETTTLDGDATYFVQRGEFAMVTNSKEMTLEFIKRRSGLEAKFSSEAAKRFLAADLSIYVDMAAINKEYAPQIKEMRKLIEQSLGQVTQLYHHDKNAAEMIKGVADLLFQAVEDSRTVTVNMEFQPEGLALQAEVLFPATTKTGAILKSFKPSLLAELVKLPSGQMIYMGMKVEPALLKLFPTALFGSSASPDNERNHLLHEAIKRLTDANPRARYTSAQMPLEGMQIWDYERPAQAVEAQLQILQSLKAGDTFEGMVLKEPPEVKANAITYRDLKLHSARTVWDMDKMISAVLKGLPPESNKEASQQLAAMMKRVAGEERQTWFGVAGNAVVQVIAKDWTGAQRQFDQFLDGKAAIGKDVAFQATLRRLPAETSMLALIEAGSYTGFLSEFIGANVKVPPVEAHKPIGIPMAAEGPITPITYLGVAITLQPERCSMNLWVPAPAIGAFYKVFEPIFKLAAEIKDMSK